MKIETVSKWMARTKKEPRKVDFKAAYKSRYKFFGPGKKFKKYTKEPKKTIDQDV